MVKSTEVMKIVGEIGGISSIIVALSAWLGKVFMNRNLQKQIYIYDIEIDKLKTEMQKQIDESKVKLNIIENTSIRYSEYQFKVYNELWGELYALLIFVDELWEKANMRNLRNFIEQINKTKNQIKKNALLIEESHLAQLI